MGGNKCKLSIVLLGVLIESGTTFLGGELSKIKNIICLPECQWYARLLKIYGEERICSKKLINLLSKEISFQRYWKSCRSVKAE